MLAPLTYDLHIPIGDRILFPVSGVKLRFFRAKARPENAVGMLGAEVGALFQLMHAHWAMLPQI